MSFIEYTEIVSGQKMGLEECSINFKYLPLYLHLANNSRSMSIDEFDEWLT